MLHALFGRRGPRHKQRTESRVVPLTRANLAKLDLASLRKRRVHTQGDGIHRKVLPGADPIIALAKPNILGDSASRTKTPMDDSPCSSSNNEPQFAHPELIETAGTQGASSLKTVDKRAFSLAISVSDVGQEELAPRYNNEASRPQDGSRPRLLDEDRRQDGTRDASVERPGRVPRCQGYGIETQVLAAPVQPIYSYRYASSKPCARALVAPPAIISSHGICARRAEGVVSGTSGIEPRLDPPPPWLPLRRRRVPNSMAKDTTSANPTFNGCAAQGEDASMQPSTEKSDAVGRALSAIIRDEFRAGLVPTPPALITEWEVETLQVSYESVAIMNHNELRIRSIQAGAFRPSAFEAQVLYMQIDGKPSLPDVCPSARTTVVASQCLFFSHEPITCTQLVRPEYRIWMTCEERHERHTVRARLCCSAGSRMHCSLLMLRGACARQVDPSSTNKLENYACFHLGTTLELAARKRPAIDLCQLYHVVPPGGLSTQNGFEGRRRVRIFRVKNPLKKTAKWRL